MVSKADSLGGGASRVAETLSTSLRERGVHTTHFTALSSAGYDEHRRPFYGNASAQRLTSLAYRAVRKTGFVDAIPFELAAVILSGILSRYDVVHFHDLSSAISPATIAFVAMFRPVVWTFHDCSPFTGGCLYPLNCRQYVDRCGRDYRCPEVGGWPLRTKFDRTYFLQHLRASVHKHSNVTAIAPSEWMARMARDSGKVTKQVRVVSNGIDANIFKPHPKFATRRKYGLPLDRPVVLISSAVLGDARKGVRESIAALRSIADLKPHALIVGERDEPLLRELGPLTSTVTGYIKSPSELSEWYACADAFLFCSLADNQPLSVLETMACGTPLVGFAIGGLPEMIADGVQGKLVAAGHACDLEQALREVIASSDSMGASARKRVEERFTLSLCAEQHEQLYRDVLLGSCKPTSNF